MILFSQLGEEMSGVVEVIGMVSNKGAIMASVYNVLREDKGINFGRSLFIVTSITDKYSSIHLG